MPWKWPGLELVQNTCHVPAFLWKTNQTWINDMEFGVDFDQTAVDLLYEMTRN